MLARGRRVLCSSSLCLCSIACGAAQATRAAHRAASKIAYAAFLSGLTGGTSSALSGATRLSGAVAAGIAWARFRVVGATEPCARWWAGGINVGVSRHSGAADGHISANGKAANASLPCLEQ